MIKEIHCFGTSFTAGGGFEWEAPHKKLMLANYYSETPFTQFNYSWPGQLQNIIGNSIKVFNHAKNGFGNDRMYRKTFDVIESSEKLDDKLFIYEFSGLQRKEIYSNTFKKHLIVNYTFEEDGSNWVTGITDRYFITDVGVENQLRPVVEPYFKETIDFFVEQKLIDQQAEYFVDYLIHNQINFLVIDSPRYQKTENKVRPYTIDFGNGLTNVVDFSMRNELTITHETKGGIVDGHGGLKWAKHVAKKVAINFNLLKTNNSSII